MTPTIDQCEYNLPGPDDAIGVATGAVAGLYRRWALVAVLGCQAAMLLAFHVSRSWHCAPDSALYMGLARSLAEGDGYTFNGEFHAMVPPLFPLAMAGFMRVFGSSFLALNCFQIALALACTPAVFLLMRRIFGRDLGLLAAAAFAFNMELWNVASMLLSDLQFTLLAALGMWAAAWAAGNGPARWAAVVLAGLGIAAASLTRSNGFVIVPGAALAVWLGWRGRPGARLAGVALLATLALAPVIWWQQYVAAHTSGHEPTYLSASHLSKPLAKMIPAIGGNLFGETFTVASNLMVGFNDVPPGLNLILPALIVIGCLTSLRRGEPMLPLSLVCMVGVLTIVPGVKERYFLFLYPAMVVFLVVGAVSVGRMAARWSPSAPRRSLRTALIFLAVAGAIGIGHSIVRGISYRRGETPGGSRIPRDQDWFVAARYIRDRHDRGQAGGREALALTSNERVLFYVGRVRGVPLTRVREELRAEAFRNMVWDRRPNWLVADMRQPASGPAVEALRAMGVGLTPVTDAPLLSGTVKMWRMFLPPAGQAARAATWEGT